MSVFLEVEHITTYRYNKPVEFSPHRVMFRPRAAHDIRVLSATLEASPHSTQYWLQDVFSNSVAVVEPRVPADVLTLHARFVIEHFGVKNLELPLAPEAENYPFQYSLEDRLDLSPFLPPQYPDDQPLLHDWVAQFLPRRGTIHTRDILANINAAIRSDFQYQSRDAVGTQRPSETLKLRCGTCRDFALLMMEVMRGLGLAARFVSGYLYDQTLDTSAPPVVRNTALQQGAKQIESRDEPLVVGAGATHAWLHVYLPGAGWVPYDPTNSLVGGTDLIRVAFTRTPEQAAPVAGSWFGAAQDFVGMDVSVSVRRIGQPIEAVSADACPS
ncbi:transglutaminase family protein [Paraburkholderia sp. C35]|uniref:transglutaminase family protein n=1 Tax=Paraburkholderia sp. C35 TaxID=2126993 RepID=UPI000D698C8B|nr:transglutaminase family protein [Paraburkholderia sp. C35]